MNPPNDQPVDPQRQDQSRDEPMNPLNDKPIERPDDDQFGFSPFAEALAQSIIKNENPEGMVIAINGPWGAGKSSVINLVKHYLKKKIKPNQSPDSFEFPRRAPNWLKSLGPKRRPRQPSEDASSSSKVSLEILDFKCWWFRGEEALMIEFFHQLYRALDKSDLKAKEAVRRLGLMTLRGLAVPSFAAGVPIIGPIIGKMISDVLSRRVQEKKTVETLYDKISQALFKSEKRYLMIIDDIDRLSKDEALLIFRLVKSVGRLPKITYLLAYDREVAEKIVSESGGPRYLEKIVQAGFDIPYPLGSDLLNFFWNSLSELRKNLEELDNKHLNDIFHAVVAPEIQSPRDSIHIVNVLSITWPAVAGEVDPVDFLALETLRIKQPHLYAILKANKQKLTGPDWDVDKDIFLKDLPEERREGIKQALLLLFPRLGSVWEERVSSSGIDETRSQLRNWKCQRRACFPEYFDTYFRFSLSPETISSAKVNTIIRNSGDENYIKLRYFDIILEMTMRSNVNINSEGILLDELEAHVNRIPDNNFKAFLSGLFAAYKYNMMKVKSDQSRDLIRVSEKLLLGRTTLDKRSKIIFQAIKCASLTLTAEVARQEYLKYYPWPPQNRSPKSPENCLMTKSDMEKLRQIVLTKVRAMAEDNSLLEEQNLYTILKSWQELSDNSQNDDEVRLWCMEKLDENDTNVEMFAKMFLEEFEDKKEHLHVLEITVPSPSPFLKIEKLKLKARVDEVFNITERDSERYEILSRFKELLENNRNELN